MIGDLAVACLRLGARSFGGPAAHVALMEDVLVRRKGWLAREAFLDVLGASHPIGGPRLGSDIVKDRVRQVPVVGEVAVACRLFAGAGLLVRSARSTSSG